MVIFSHLTCIHNPSLDFLNHPINQESTHAAEKLTSRLLTGNAFRVRSLVVRAVPALVSRLVPVEDGGRGRGHHEVAAGAVHRTVHHILTQVVVVAPPD